MKKILLGLFSICLSFICVFSLVGCKSKDYSQTTTDTSKVTANGGSALIYNENGTNYLYFVNGTTDNTAENNGGKSVGSVYKVALDENGKIAENASYTKVIDNLVGYKNGSINIIGDFLYYTTPNTGKNKSGSLLNHKVDFMRYDLKKGYTQSIYTTQLHSEDEEQIEFSYYNQNDSLYLLVYEPTNKSLTSVKVGTEMSTIFVKDNITDAIFSENMGVSNYAGSNADNFVYYTKDVENADVVKTGNKVYMVKPDGSNEELISDSVKVTLETICAGKLVFSAEVGTNCLYAYSITEQTKLGDLQIFETNNPNTPNSESFKHIISENVYEDGQVAYIADGNDIAILCYESSGSVLRYFKYVNGTMVEDNIVSTFPTSATIAFIDVFADEVVKNGVTAKRNYLVFTNKDDGNKVLYKVCYKSTDASEQAVEATPVKLSTSAILDAEGNMMPKIVGNYVYAFIKDKDNNILQYRVNLYTPKEQEEQVPGTFEEDEELVVGKAEVIGSAEL